MNNSNNNNIPQQRAILNRGFINTTSGKKEILIVPSSQIQLQTAVSSTSNVSAGPTVVAETSIYNTNGFSTNLQNEPRAPAVPKLTFNHPRLSGSYISPTVISGSMKRHPPLQYDLLQPNNK
uniref:Uncharacterized protein n=1 Tax=Romanomermis culicivorax TaxID=13658 RepID=A0A915HRV9_ROMCU